MEQQTKIDAAIKEIKYQIEIAEREYESVLTKINSLRDVLDNLDKIKRNEKLK
jgi:prefoldin subunit 5